MTKSIISIFLFLFLSTNLISQEESNKPVFRFQGDSRMTFVNKKSVNIFGIRGGLLFKDKYEVGLGIYSSNLFGLLGKDVRKDYLDKRFTPAIMRPASINFHYISIYGEYHLLENNRWKFSFNSQFGLGRVNINFIDPSQEKENIREGKSFLEHSVKADVKILRWLRIIGGIGYRYLVVGEPQIKDAFNAPIYIVGFSIDFKKLFKKE